MTGYRCAACGWEQRPHPTYGWQTHDEHAVAVHKDRLCPNPMADPRIIPAEELARYEANVLRVNGWAYYMDAESERVIKRLIEHGKAQAEQVATLTRDLAHREKYDPQWADAFRSIEARADAAETQADKAWKILGDLGFCVRCKDGSTMPCVECGAGL